ncbi:nose resistant to fluoxetine protein 6-like isoform X1 [Dermacentor albipictus]|uniref:nose resistant to fluoxetine protein 6-like isoform X1 n=1 Tax=Dermacentor albipictus TaxID=60249 RepID=UPI0038FCB0F3
MASPRYKKSHGPLFERLTALSAYETARKIFVVKEPADDETRRLQVFHGLRALSIMWIVWVHHYAYNDTSVYSGAKIAKKLVVQYNTQPFNNAWLAVDTFFFISGFFLLYAIYKQMRSAGLGQVLFYLAVRWWRLIPMACMGIFMLTLIRHFGEGPLWNEYIDAEIKKCNKNWWLLLLNVQNFLRHDELCLVPYWYISVDTQLHIFFIGFAILLFRNFYLSVTAMLFLVITSSIVVACQTLVHNYTPTALFVAGDSTFAKEVLEQIYFRPYTHFGPFCLGMIIAYAFLTKKPRFELGWVCQGVTWIAVLLAGATVLFCPKQWGDGDTLPAPWIAAAYASCHRLVWALCIGWLVFACISDSGGLVNSVLCSPLLVPLSRLSYPVYVLHVPIVWFRLWTIRERILIWFLPMFYNAMGTFVLSFFVALGASIFIERPLVVVKDLVVSCIAGPRNCKSSQPDGHRGNGGGKADVFGETRRLGPSVGSFASKLHGGPIFAKQAQPPTATPTTAGYESESCTVHL